MKAIADLSGETSAQRNDLARYLETDRRAVQPTIVEEMTPSSRSNNCYTHPVNPIVDMLDMNEWDNSNLVVKYRVPYSDLRDLPSTFMATKAVKQA